MKFIDPIAALMLIIFSHSSFAQCPEGGLRIQSAACESPFNLRVMPGDCPELTLSWQGSQPAYLIKATITDTATGQVTRSVIEQYQCANNGACRAMLKVKAGNKVYWTVQAICSEGNSRLYSYAVAGDSATGLHCAASNRSVSPALLHVYPNPTTGELTVDYPFSGNGPPIFTVMDISGKKTLFLTGKEVTRTGTGYQLHLQRLLTGVYLLKITDGEQTSQAKFMMGKN
jgi:hypothetical protein